ncbi:acyl-CoA thioester hydrolase/BAAT C-terminal domain-containing protein [Clostridium beijerinckii]|jgi:BAAT / Acyl-CoA thioester hydrolase C terminal.|nr:acyl-CoA thioester hydrolase/BAAT C-terminal domain-containing protein [Clostridium beijerinckii]MBF7807877.1 acyl-CoA thioester hydrolase [Clostridium beijerinckii]NRT26332.1 esterase/lipase [Clostridium beijerinckii]NRT66061.1 esterase/lipase [Clostridium beijerinckii]NRT82429.1 esterase/lipase [Clostridium beijerinckii]NRU50869.1 esterase/lipase [Clostridium beijerinckii]
MEYRTEELYGDFYENDEKPLVIVIGSVQPGIPIISKELLEYLKSKFNVLLLAYFGVGDLPKRLERIPLEYFIKAINHFKNKLNLNDEDIVLMGSNKGGELVLLLISKYINPSVAIACVPSCYVWQAIPKGIMNILIPKSSWTFKNKDIPFVRFRYNREVINDIKNKKYNSSHLFSIQTNKNKNALIKVDQYKGRLLLISTEKDHYWPSKGMCEFIEKSRKGYTKHIVFNCDGDQLLKYKEPSMEIMDFLEL